MASIGRCSFFQMPPDVDELNLKVIYATDNSNSQETVFFLGFELKSNGMWTAAFENAYTMYK